MNAPELIKSMTIYEKYSTKRGLRLAGFKKYRKCKGSGGECPNCGGSGVDFTIKERINMWLERRNGE